MTVWLPLAYSVYVLLLSSFLWALTTLLLIGPILTSILSDQSESQNLVGALRKGRKYNCLQAAQEEY